jgi:hypothetical protein
VSWYKREAMDVVFCNELHCLRTLDVDLRPRQHMCETISQYIPTPGVRDRKEYNFGTKRLTRDTGMH